MKKKFFLIIAAILLIALTFWNQRHTKKMNLRTTGVYEVDMRVARVVDRKTNDYIEKQWRIDIPRKYIASTRGHNAVPNQNPKKRNVGNDQRIEMSAVFDLETMTLAPNPSSNKRDIVPGSVFWTLRNTGSNPKFQKTEQCLSRDEWQRLFGLAVRSPTCNDHMFLCGAQMQMDGWGIEIFIDKTLLDDLQSYCDVIEEFLDEQTINRDSLFEE